MSSIRISAGQVVEVLRCNMLRSFKREGRIVRLCGSRCQVIRYIHPKKHTLLFVSICSITRHARPNQPWKSS